MALPICSRTNDILEPMLKEQWFVRVSKLFDICGQAVKEEHLKINPEHRIKLWYNYSNVFAKKDWCISRQLWWGHRIPAYKCHVKGDEANFKWIVAEPEQALKEAQNHFNQSNIIIQQGKPNVFLFCWSCFMMNYMRILKNNNNYSI
jgi:valyl-tRNA synthetase